MKVLLINGSPKGNGNTFQALSEVARTLNAEDIETEIVSIGKQAVQGCVACGWCGRMGKCTYNDDLYYKVWRAVKDGIDGLVVGSPVYYGGPNGSLCALLDRVFYSLGQQLQYKPAACVVVCRRGGASAAFDRLNKYFTIMNMPVVSSQYWNMAYGARSGEARRRRYADDAYARTQHGLDDQETECGRRWSSPERAVSLDQFHQIRLNVIVDLDEG